MFGLSWWHILLVLIVFVLLFGAGRISGLMADTARGLKSFKKGLSDEGEEALANAKAIEEKRAKTQPEARRAGSKATRQVPRKTS